MEDTKILDLYWARSEQAIQETDKSYGGRLWTLANAILNNREDAEESVSDTYMQAWNTIPPQRPRHFFGFLASVCRHLSLNRVDWRLAAKRNAEVVALTQEMEACIPDKRIGDEMEGKEAPAGPGRISGQPVPGEPADLPAAVSVCRHRCSDRPALRHQRKQGQDTAPSDPR